MNDDICNMDVEEILCFFHSYYLVAWDSSEFCYVDTGQERTNWSMAGVLNWDRTIRALHGRSCKWFHENVEYIIHSIQ